MISGAVQRFPVIYLRKTPKNLSYENIDEVPVIATNGVSSLQMTSVRSSIRTSFL
jgi:hypothetical protein